MLSDAELQALFEARATPADGMARIRLIRKSLPARVARTNKLSAKTRYVPIKMPFVLEAEARETEYVALVEYDHDPEVLEMYSQVEGLKISYLGPEGGRRISTPTTPDIFLIRKSGFVFVECKREEELVRLQRCSPNRYCRDATGRWRSPPAEAAAAELGCEFKVRSSAETNWTLHENLELLKDYFGALELPVSDVSRNLVAARLKTEGWISVFDLVHVEPAVPADALYALIAQRAVYFPLATQRLTEQNRALVFRDEMTYRAHSTFLSVRRSPGESPSVAITIEPGSTFSWDGNPWQIINSGASRLSIQRRGADDGSSSLAELKHEDFQALVLEGRIVAHRVPGVDAEGVAERRLRNASPQDLAEAQRKYEVLIAPPEARDATPKRTRLHWKRLYRDFEAQFGNGFAGLIPQRHGNRRRKVSHATLALAEEVIATDWETIRHKQRRASYGEYKNRAKEEGALPISYQTFCKLVKSRSGHAQTAARYGEKAAYDLEPQYLELEYTTPRHGVRPWHIAHIDHTPLPLKIVHSTLGSIERTVWLTILIDANTRKILAYYLSFDEPSYRSCMMVLRDCVRRHHRVPQIIVCDRGPEFSSTYWETQLALVRAVKRDRRAGRPREGSVCERIFNTSQIQFVKALLGAADVVEKYFRRISPEMRPEQHAVWTIDMLDRGFQRYLDEVYHVNRHSGLGMSPDEAWALGIRSHGERMHVAIPYDKTFIAQSCPAVHRAVVKVQPSGVKINYRWFKCAAFREPGVLNQEVPARYDPFNVGIAYAYVRGEWHECRSEFYAQFVGRTEREIRLASERIRLTDRISGKAGGVTAERLALFLSDSEVEESVAAQRRADAEAASHRAKINAVPIGLPEQAPVSVSTSPADAAQEAMRSASSRRRIVARQLEDL